MVPTTLICYLRLQNQKINYSVTKLKNTKSEKNIPVLYNLTDINKKIILTYMEIKLNQTSRRFAQTINQFLPNRMYFFEQIQNFIRLLKWLNQTLKCLISTK